uniref:FLYWCH-type domain-containing protein n=1 Tax=Panagrolaimus sp. ES5 TaxID=591445 RepID=A0AC34FKF3_9BILA
MNFLDMNDEEGTFAVNDVVKVLDTRLRKPVAQIGGFEYKFNHCSKTTGICYWRCTKHQSDKCKAVIYTNGIADGTSVCEIKHEHNHIGDSLAAELRSIREAAHLIAAENPNLSTREIIAQATSSASDALKTKDIRENLARMIRNRRQNSRVIEVEPSPAPANCSLDNIPEISETNNAAESQTSETELAFVVFDSATTNDITDGRIVIMGKAKKTEMIRFLTHCINKIEYGEN